MEIESISEILRILRAKYKLTQEQIAEKCDLQAAHIGKLERNEHEPTLSTLNKIAKGFNMSVIDLLSLNAKYLEVPSYDEVTCKIITICEKLSKEEREHLYKIAKTFIKR